MAAVVMGRRERKKLQSKQTILAAAVKQFMAKGVKETSIADIMGEAELGVGTFYNYFESKEALLLCLLDQIVEDTRRLADQRMAERIPASEVLVETLLLTAEKLDANRFVLPLFLSAADRSSMPRPKRDLIPRIAPTFRTVFADIVKYGQARKDFRGDVPAEIVTELFHSIFQAAAFSSLAIPFVHNVKMKVELLLKGLEPKK